MNQWEFMCVLNKSRPKIFVVDGRIQFRCSNMTALRDALNEYPELETKLILRLAVKRPALLDEIQERAAIRWSNGYSDSLYSAVMCNIRQIDEPVERDENGRIILRPKTDWEKELDKYR